MKATAIICAFNEENTISNLLIDVLCTTIFDEVIVINDGSSDNTKQYILELKLRFEFTDIHLNENHGKGYAMSIGVEIASSECIVFIDADLSNFSDLHARFLLNPLFNNKAAMVMGQLPDTVFKNKTNPFRSLTGQRAVYKNDIIQLVEKMKPSGYGVETIINMYYKANHKKVIYVRLDQLYHHTKFKKSGTQKALSDFAIEGYQILASTISNFNLGVKIFKNSILNQVNSNN